MKRLFSGQERHWNCKKISRLCVWEGIFLGERFCIGAVGQKAKVRFSVGISFMSLRIGTGSVLCIVFQTFCRCQRARLREYEIPSQVISLSESTQHGLKVWWHKMGE